MGKGGIVFYFWEADATEKGSLGPNTVVNSNPCLVGNRDGVGGDRLLKGPETRTEREAGRPNFFSQGSLGPKLPT